MFVDSVHLSLDIDVIDICNPTHLHPETALKALADRKVMGKLVVRV